MSALPNPGTVKTSFTDYAEAQGSSVLSAINRIFVGELAYKRDPSGTALTTFDGGTWSPLGQVTLAHWNAEGTAFNPGAAGQLNEPDGNDQTKIEAALAWCAANGKELYGDTSRVYGVTGPLYVGGVTGSRTWGLHDLNLYVKSWSATVTPRAGDDPDAWEQDAAVLTIGSNGANPLRFFRMSNIHIDCARLAGTGVRYLHASQLSVDDVAVDRARTFGHDIGRPAYIVTTVSSTASRYSRLRSREFWYSTDPADGYTDWSVRTSCGIRVSGSDCSVAESEFSTAAICGALGQGFNAAFDNCIWWGNPAPSGPLPPGYATRNTFVVSKTACNYRFGNCSYQDGRLVVHGSAVNVGSGTTPAFQGQFVGCTFAQYSGPQIVFVAHDAAETATTLIFLANRVKSYISADLAVEGSGSWGDFSGEWAGNTREDGTSLTVQSKGLIQGYFSVYSDGRVRAAALTPTPSTPGMDAMWCVGADGTLYTYGAGNWYSHTGTLVT